jgi:hypothetical protein
MRGGLKAEGRISNDWSVFGDAYVSKPWQEQTDYGVFAGLRYRW